jgi:hypothetical protein
MEEKDVHQRTSVKAVSCRRHEESTSLEDREAFIRKQAHHNAFYLFIVNFYAALLVFGKYLITLETILGSTLGVGFTLLAYYRTVRRLYNNMYQSFLFGFHTHKTGTSACDWKYER